MIKARLLMALDLAKNKASEHDAYSHRVGDKWQIVKCGPGYHNLYEVTECDDEGLTLLLSNERK